VSIKNLKDNSSEFLSIFRYEAPIAVLGPGLRAGIWVQGCPFTCKGCIVPESWNTAAGERVKIEELARWVLTQPDITGITLSGGEPMAQAAALIQLIDTVQSEADLGVMCYTGYVFERLQQHGTNAQQALLERIDLLVDGLYVENLHADLLWRGSTNQRLLPLSERHRTLIENLEKHQDCSAGMEFFMNESGVPSFVGVPPVAGFRRKWEETLLKRGIILGSSKNE